MDRAHRGEAKHAGVEDWELCLVKQVCSVFRTLNRDELEAELERKLWILKTRAPSGVRNWRAYLAKFLYNKAHNFVRDERSRFRREAALAKALSVTQSREEPPEHSTDLWDALSPEDRELCLQLVELGGNQSRVAERLGIHRNTVRARLQRIRSHVGELAG